MDEEPKMQMSALNPVLPRYYNGYDIDVLLRKIKNKESLTKDEEAVFDEAWKIYYEKYHEEGRKKWDAWKTAHPGEYTKYINIGRKDKRWERILQNERKS